MTREQETALSFDLRNLPTDFYDDPFPYYRALREHAPVKRLPDGSAFLTRYADVLAVYQDQVRFSSDKKSEFGPKFGVETRLFRHHTTSLVFNDAPYHTRIRRVLIGALIPRALERLAPKLERLVEGLLDHAQQQGSFDAIADFAAAIPVEVIGDLLAIPKADRGPLRGWSQAILGALEPVLSPEARVAGEEALAAFHIYLAELIHERGLKPLDPNEDVLTRLMQSDGAALSAVELAENCVFLLNAGHETTTNLIGNAIELLARYPDQKQILLENPVVMRSTIEEVLRYESPNQLGNRIATEDTVLGTERIRAGTSIVLCIGAANRDPSAFGDPERFDVMRRHCPHLAFGSGVHQCAGMNLARLEARIALTHLLLRIPKYQLLMSPVRNRRARFRGFAALPVQVS